MLALKNLTLRRGTRALFENVTLTIFPGQKIGLTGANGSGKSSLFALLRGELHADAGDLELPAKWVVAHVAQETPAVARAALDYALDGDVELREVEAALAAAEAAHDGLRLAELHARFEAIGGWTARARAAQLLAGLGFTTAQLDRPVAEFSGGWRMRLNLARALMCRSDLLLLDEPTNHLDLDAVIWLEGWLAGYPGTLLLVSHDRDFLDNVVGAIAHIEQQGITLYSGNYEAFERQRAERLAQQQAAHEKQQREIAHLESYIARFRAKATKARQAQSRIKALGRMELIAAAHVDSPFGFAFRAPASLPHPLLSLDGCAVGYGATPLLERLTLDIQPGTRLGLLGPNGAGKSTLIKLLAGQLAPLAGQRREGQGLAIGYFAQHQMEALRPERSAVQHIQALSPSVSEQDIRDFLGGFDFRGDRALEPVAPFSGGEKARLALAILVWQRPNLLLLDEPTNHLDLEMRHALTLALQDFEGALIVVSHDRHLLRTCTDAFLIVGEGRARPFDGDLDDYRDWLAERARAAARRDDAERAPAEHSAAVRKEQKRLEAEARNRLAARRRPLERELATIERALDTLNAARTRIETALADPAAYAEANKAALKALLAEQAEVAKGLATQEERWLELQEELERLSE
ncbi:ATP-binding cassette subfamily F protein 3 [Plasticicumulans lactativorans]|uniref:Probable ATP-binding protein YheS n=1 Tax=Plasticicumulans lactativorans TaxID=1133106 RepID=A0A4R2LKB7_9GAMM|nr:ATP-binding cassette domain-containing protein [Plasticicumulans lactativorans]TCO83723.1 ATP-binding cassette subfamily F protein 3 [Plasticicumulans lactativorans]